MNHTPYRVGASGANTTAFTSDQMQRSKNMSFPMAASRSPIPEKMLSSIESKRKGEIISKIENLFPYLQEIMGQNDIRSNTIINRLVSLRDNLDQIFE